MSGDATRCPTARLDRRVRTFRRLRVRYSAAMIRIALISVEILLGLGALVTGVWLLIRAAEDASVSPRRGGAPVLLQRGVASMYRYAWPTLLVLIGAAMFAAAGLLLARGSAARLVSLEAGIVLLALIAAQLVTPGYRHRLQPIALLLGLAVVALSLALRSPG